MDASVPSSGDSRYRVMAAREFVRRFRRGVAHDEKIYAWLLGAGCSVSSGVPGAEASTRAWLKELKYLESGQEDDVEAWAVRRFVGYDPTALASIYGEVMSALFHTDADRRREIERQLADAEPGFGYATLAQLMTHAKWGARAALALSVNYDDLLADALHVYSQKRPQVVSQEALSPATPLNGEAPTVLKLHGDAHLPYCDEQANRPRFRESVRERLRETLSDSGLIIVGYGGREECVLDMLEGLPPGGPAGGVFWVNEQEPQGAFGDWLEQVGAVWVKHSDFDELMYFIRVEFGLGHPKIDRFERVFRKYNAQYRELSTRSGMRIAPTPNADGSSAEPQAIAAPRRAPEAERGPIVHGPEESAAPIEAQEGRRESAIGLGGLDSHVARRETDQSRRERLRQSLHAYTKALSRTGETEQPKRDPRFRRGEAGEVSDLLDAAVIELHGAARRQPPPEAPPPDQDARGGQRPLRRADLESVLGNGEGASADPQRARRTPDPEQEDFDSDLVDEDGGDLPSEAAASESRAYPPEIAVAGVGDWDAGDPDRVPVPAGPSFWNDAGRGDRGDVGDVVAKLADAREISIPPREDARPPAPRPSRSAAESAGAPGAERQTAAQQRAAELARMGRMLVAGRRRGEGTEIALRESDGLPPEPTRKLPVSQGSFGEASFAAAIEAAPEDPLLRARFARFLAVGVGDLRRAEAVFEEAQQLAPDNVSVLRDYAAFALDRLREPKRAERLLALALHHNLRNADTLRQLAEFLERAHGDLDEAENCLRLAIEVQPDNPRNFITYARFLIGRRGRREAAEAQLRRAAELKPENAAALAELALFHAFEARALDAAQKTVERAAKIGPNDPEVAFARAAIAELKGELEEAEAQYRRCLDAAPADIRAQLAYAAFLEKRRGDLDAAETCLRAATALAPHRGAPHSAYARFLETARGDLDGAEARHRDAVAADPFDAACLAAFAEHLAAREGREIEAEEMFRDALALAPRSAEALRAYGRFLEQRGDADAAEAQFRAAVEVDPHGAESYDALAQFLHVVREDAEEAELYFREALKIAPNRSETLNRFASFLRATKRDLDEAESYYRRALESNPRDAHSLARSAQFLLSKGRRAEGLKVLNEAFDSAWRMDPAIRPASLMLELWIYRYAHDPARREESLRAAIALIEGGVRCEGWDLAPTVKQSVAAGHPDPDVLNDLAGVAAEGMDPAPLLKRGAR